MKLAQLREQTAELHQEVEREIDLLSPDLSVERYVRILCAFQACFVPWETALDAHCPASATELWTGRRRAHRIANDLRALGAEAALASSTQIEAPDLSEPGDWFGCLYVVEGSTLGGQVISRHLEKHFGWTDGHGYSFFRGYGENTADQWRKVCAALESAPISGNQMVEAAHLTFVQLRRCLRLFV